MMVRRPMPPTPEPVSDVLRWIRLGMVPIVALGLGAGVLVEAVDLPIPTTPIFVSSLLVGLGSLALPRWYGSAAALAGLLVLTWGTFGRLFPPIYPTLVTVAALGIGVAVGVRSHRLPSDLTADGIRRAPDGAVGKGAERFVAMFEDLGYRRAGALSARMMGFEVVLTIMVGPDRDRWASVTDSTLVITSAFQGRLLATRNSGMTGMPPHVVANDLRGAEPPELDDAHEHALAELSSYVGSPDELDVDLLVDRVLDHERSAVEWARSQGRTIVQSRSGKGAGPLSEDPHRRGRISVWMDARPGF